MITEWAAHQDTIQNPYIVQQNGSSLSTTQEKQSVPGVDTDIAS